ncbi:nucleoporin nup49 [Grosmannia clavigera kw1407]|uniref:Nucleoporin nup49 n=1 Tax=Grosmannia clavigera (strain kw1407 / UAMH 11150) TaxID=655863 RepID=F0XCB8_GROCL|nr:nucleoporin nup49 [Grosmannia clavigera kw1407]EFX04639.1 nucleoporin nup49 [Grosmannia clavigera kw1407]
MLARSASGPGGLSINTGSANLFGGSTTTSQPQAGGLFGSTTTQAGTAAATTTAAATPSMFEAAAGTGTTSASGGLFGQAAAKPATGGGLFGGGTAMAQPAATAAAGGGGLFGASTTTAAPAGGLFGTAAPATTPASGGGLFGTAAPATTAAGVRIDVSNLKGTTRFNDLHESLQKDIMAFDSLIQSYVEQKNQVAAFLPAHGESLAAIPDDVRFVGRKYDGVSSALGSDLQAIQVLRETVKQDAEHAQLSFKALDNQKLPAQFHTSGLWSTAPGGGGGGGGAANRRNRDGSRSRTRTRRGSAGGGVGGRGGDADDHNKAGDDFGGIDGEGSSGGTDLINYFSQTGDEIGGQLRRLEKNLGEIEVHMYGVQSGLLEQLQRVAQDGGGSSSNNNNGSGSSAEEKVAELAGVLREFEDSILTAASVVGAAREDVTALQLGRYLGH